MKNRLTDLNDALFAQLERLTADDLSPEQLEAELRRTGAIVQVADRIADGARLQLDAAKFVAGNNGGTKALPPSLALPAASTTAGKV